MHHHKDFTVQELAADPSFQRMAKGSATPEEVEKWNHWIELNDSNRAKAKKALSKISGFEFKSPDLPDFNQQWSRLDSKTTGLQKNLSLPLLQNKRKKSNEDVLKWIFRVAAIILILSFASFGDYFFSDAAQEVTHLKQLTEEKKITTAEGEEKTLTFSNGSKVILNSNSVLTYRIGVLHNQTIEVMLEGEAWFDAQHDSSTDQPAFSVNTPDGIIRDIGTKFLVTVLNDQSRVVLQEGLVEIEPVNKSGNGVEEKNEVIRVGIGEMVSFSQSNILARKTVNPTFYTSWATGFMEFEGTGIQEFAEYVEQRFDVKTEINDKALTDITVDGTVYFRSLDELVRSVSEVFGIPVYRSEDRKTVYIGNPQRIE